jgi:hypothetical protein
MVVSPTNLAVFGAPLSRSTRQCRVLVSHPLEKSVLSLALIVACPHVAAEALAAPAGHVSEVAEMLDLVLPAPEHPTRSVVFDTPEDLPHIPDDLAIEHRMIPRPGSSPASCGASVPAALAHTRAQ